MTRTSMDTLKPALSRRRNLPVIAAVDITQSAALLLAIAAAGILFFSAPGAITSTRAQTACPTISGPVATTQNLSAGETCTVEEGGEITTAGDAINGTGGGHTVTIYGGITTTGNDAEGVTVDGNGSTIVVGPTGTIETNGQAAYGIHFNGDNNTLASNGAIITMGERAHGIFAEGDNNTLTNSGTIMAMGNLTRGLLVEGNNNTIINSGLIQASGTDSFSIDIDTSATNQKNTLTLLPGSRLIGVVELSTGTNAGEETVNFHNRVGTAITFDDTGDLPEVIDTIGWAYLTITPNTGNPYVVVIDPTVFAQAGAQLHDLTASISNSVHAQLDAARIARSRFAAGLRGAAHAAQIAADISDDFGSATDPTPAATATQERFRIWAQGFGAYREADAQGIQNDAKHKFFGGIIGLDMALDMASFSDTRVGAFAGYSRGDLETGRNMQKIGHNSQDVETDTVFGGIYADYAQPAWYARLILGLGTLDNDSTRLVMDNTAPNGFWLAKGSYDGIYFSPEVAVGTDFTVGGMTLMPSARLRYAHLSLDGYTETGRPTGAVASELDVADRDVNLFAGRAQVAMAKSWGALSVVPRFGIEAYSSDADGVSVTIAGSSVNVTPGNDDAITGFVGARLSTNLGGAASLFADGEAHFGDGTTRYEGRLGAAVHF